MQISVRLRSARDAFSADPASTLHCLAETGAIELDGHEGAIFEAVRRSFTTPVVDQTTAP